MLWSVLWSNSWKMDSRARGALLDHGGDRHGRCGGRSRSSRYRRQGIGGIILYYENIEVESSGKVRSDCCCSKSQ
jgi:hypothetical protein